MNSKTTTPATERDGWLMAPPAGAFDLNRDSLPYLLFVRFQEDNQYNWRHFGAFQTEEIALEVLEALQENLTINHEDSFRLYRREAGGYKLMTFSDC